jgi:ABC-type transport system substrate-binding protein
MRDKRSRLIALIAALVALALAITACGGDGNGDTKAKAKALSTLTIANPGFPPTMDPALADNAYSDYYNLAYDPLIIRAADGSYKPGLALSWEYGPRNESFSITLRPNVRFSDGEKLDAAAVKTWLNHAMTFPNPKGYLADLKSIEVTGPLTLTLRFGKPTPLLELVFSQFLEVGMIGSPKAVKAKTLGTETAGTGPYILDKANTVVRDHYTFVPNPNYWNKKAVYWKKVVNKVIANPSAALQALKTGQVQIALAQPVTNIDAAKRAGLKYVAPPSLMMGLSLLDRGGKLVEPLGDVRVRQALNYAVDRKAVARVLGGVVTEQMAVHGDPEGFDPGLEKRYPYDPEKAKQLLAEAGYPNGFTLRAISIKVVDQDKVAALLAAQFAKIGVVLKPDIKSTFDDYVSAIASGKYPATTISWGRLPAATNYQLLWGPNASGQNPFKISDPRLEDVYRKLVFAPTEQAGLFAREMQQFLVEQAWFVPVAATPLVVMFRPEVTGVNGTLQRDNVYTNEFRPAT